jgi:hypothetical protein
MKMKWLINLSRVAILTACAIWLLTRTPGVRAQIMNCDTYNTENNELVCQGAVSSWYVRMPSRASKWQSAAVTANMEVKR